MSLKLYNSLSRKIEEFIPLHGKKVGVYTCGPTVYFYPHIGNWRTFVLGDLVHRSLKFFGYEVSYLMNITDVGHLTGDNQGDASQGEDRLEKGAKREGKTAWEVAEFYTADFKDGYKKLNMLPPITFCKATDHIKEQIEIVKKIEEKGFVYKISDGIYFDIGAYEKAGNTYGLMSNLHIDDAQSRIAENEEKKDPRDFALWKFSPEEEKRDMQWESPWGVGFPGWHIECSAMSTKYLGDQFDIHIGGEDHKSTHHPNEIAQAQAATGKKPFVKYWVHGAFLQVNGGRMGKSLGNAYTLEDIEEKGFDPEALRYFYLTGHYRKTLNFTWEALESAQNSLANLREIMVDLQDKTTGRTELSQDKLQKIEEYRESFASSVANDLNLPAALSVVWEVAKSNLPPGDKLDLIYLFDEILGLNFQKTESQKIPNEIEELARERESLRSKGEFEKADQIRKKLEEKGYKIKDTSDGSQLSLNLKRK